MRRGHRAEAAAAQRRRGRGELRRRRRRRGARTVAGRCESPALLGSARERRQREEARLAVPYRATPPSNFSRPKTNLDP